MAVPSYTTDLLTFSLAESGGTWVEMTGYTLTGTPTAETDYFIQGAACFSATMSKTGLGSCVANYGSGVTVPADGAFLVWQYYAAPNALATEASGGLRLIVGTDLSNFYAWNSVGSDTYAYGGWINQAVDPTVTADYTAGTLSTLQYVGSGVNSVNAVSKGNPLGVDAIRYGRCEARMNGGQAGNYATFYGFALVNDAISARWGLIQELDGSYLVKGLIIFGYSTAVDFRDANMSVTIQDTKKVSANFNTFEVRNVSSRVDMTAINISALGTVSPGRWVTTDNATQNILSCTFTDMSTFGYASLSTITSSVFRRCGLVTQNSATFTDCTFETSSDSVKAVLSNNPSAITNCTFISSGTKHGIELTSACAGNTYSLQGNTFTGYAATDGTTGNECIYNNSGGAVTLNLSSGTSPSIRNGTGATTSVLTSCTLTMTVTDESNNPVVGAYAYIDDNNLTPFILNTVTDSLGVASAAYSGSSVSNATWRVRKYGYKDFQMLLSISGVNINLPVTLVSDPLQV